MKIDFLEATILLIEDCCAKFVLPALKTNINLKFKQKRRKL